MTAHGEARSGRHLVGLLGAADEPGEREVIDALHAQSHELPNRLQTISSLLALGHGQEALELVREMTTADPDLGGAPEPVEVGVVTGIAAVALLMAKSDVAAEHGVTLRIATDTGLECELIDPLAVITVIGNLVDNALDAVGTGDGGQRWIEAGLAAGADGALAVAIADSGPGIPAEQRRHIFEPGYSTKPADPAGSRGIGLALVRRVVERCGGSITLAEPEDRSGARFEVRLPDAVAPAPVTSGRAAPLATGPGGALSLAA